MKKLAVLISLLALAVSATGATAAAEEPMFSHLVFFDLKDDSDTAKQALIDGGRKYLAPHEGIVAFAMGPRAEDKTRDVNDTDFDVSLAIIFESEAAQDAYQTTDAHMQFIEELKDNWAKVRVFDSVVAKP